jgi:hypothetical protein
VVGGELHCCVKDGRNEEKEVGREKVRRRLQRGTGYSIMRRFVFAS